MSAQKYLESLGEKFTGRRQLGGKAINTRVFELSVAGGYSYLHGVTGTCEAVSTSLEVLESALKGNKDAQELCLYFGRL